MIEKSNTSERFSSPEFQSHGKQHKHIEKRGEPFEALPETPIDTQATRGLDFSAAELLELDKILEHIADFAISPIASEQIRALRPLGDVTGIQSQLDEATEMRFILDGDEYFPLDYLPDLRLALQQLRIAGRALEPQQLIEVARFFGCGRRVRAYLMARREKYPLLASLAQTLTALQDVESAIENAIHFTDGAVKDSASPVLTRLRKEIRRAIADTREQLQKMLKNLAARDMLQEEVITLRDGRLALMLKDEFRHRVPGIVHDESASGRTAFVEPMESVEMNNRIRQLQSAEREEIERILLALSDRLRMHLPALQANFSGLVHFDIVHSKARFSQRLECAAPKLQSQGTLRLIGARHPLLLLSNSHRLAHATKNDKQKENERADVVPLDLELGHETLTLILTGPNAGGKTVALKTVGLLSLMTSCGLHIPAQPDSQIPIFRHIFADIGDRQSIEEDLSTFTSRMARAVEILRQANEGDLVLIDEIGSGTDPEAGAALAMAIMQALTRRRCLTVVTTHHGALKSFAHSTPGVVNGSMTFDNETLRPTYRFHPNLPGASYAFEIAERMGLPLEVIEQARQSVGKEKGNIENLLAELEVSSAEQRRMAEKLKIEETRFSALAKLYEERINAQKAQERELKKKAIAESEEILQRANATIEKAIREIREQTASTKAIRNAKTEIQTLREELWQTQRQLAEEKPVTLNSVQEIGPGVSVKWLKQNAVATVLEPPDASQRVLLQVGSLRARVPLTELQLHAAPSPAVPESLTKTDRIDTPAELPEIDLRGLRLEAALQAVDKFLDEALLAGWKEVRIIHGKGTGALRQGIGNFLKQHPQTKKFRYAAFGEGDIGVTVVELK
jgi:DNA mismatch repair protein MutS2